MQSSLLPISATSLGTRRAGEALGGGAPLCPQSMEGKRCFQAFDLKLFKVKGISWEGKSMGKTVRLLPVPRWGQGESVLGGQISHYWSLFVSSLFKPF